MATRRRVSSARFCPRNSAAPNSVTITSTSVRAVVTGPARLATILESVPPLAVLASAISEGETLEEARHNLQDALRMVLECNRELAREQTQEGGVREAIDLLAL